MKKLKIKQEVKKNDDNTYTLLSTIINNECKDIVYNETEYNTIEELNLNKESIKESILYCINEYFGEIYELDNDIISEEFYIKTQEDGRNAVNNLMRELTLFSYNNNLSRDINRKIEDTFKPVTDALLWGWWKTAKEKCEELESEIDNVIITRQLYDRIYNSIINYININYPY